MCTHTHTETHGRAQTNKQCHVVLPENAALKKKKKNFAQNVLGHSDWLTQSGLS